MGESVDKRAPKGKRRDVAALLAVFLGLVGAHKFYLGRRHEGIAHLLLMVLACMLVSSVGGLWPLGAYGLLTIAEALSYLSCTDEEFEREYVEGGRAWL